MEFINFWCFPVRHWRFHSHSSMDVALEGRDEGDSWSVRIWALCRANRPPQTCAYTTAWGCATVSLSHRQMIILVSPLQRSVHGAMAVKSSVSMGEKSEIRQIQGQLFLGHSQGAWCLTMFACRELFIPLFMCEPLRVEGANTYLCVRVRGGCACTGARTGSTAFPRGFPCAENAIGNALAGFRLCCLCVRVSMCVFVFAFSHRHVRAGAN